MASALRAKLSRRHAFSDLKPLIADDDEESSRGNSSEDSKSELTSEKKKRQSTEQHDFSGIPIPERKLRSCTITSSTSSSQSLLCKYKNRAAAKPAMTDSPLRTAKTITERTTCKEAAFAEELNLDQAPTSPERQNEPCTPEKVMTKEKRVIDGIEFEMMRKMVGEAPVGGSGDEADYHQRKQTRLQARRQQRADSHVSSVDIDSSYEIQGLTVRKIRDIERTPSFAVDQDKTHMEISDLVTPMENSLDLQTPSSPTVVEYSKVGVPISKLPTSSASTTEIPKLSSYRRHQQSKLVKDDIPPVKVIPPIFNSIIRPGYIWTSNLGSSSRPSEPWGWLKKWTCCQCAELDPFESGEPAQTMVEQTICSRIECGHERCPLGCRIWMDHRYDGPDVFSR